MKEFLNSSPLIPLQLSYWSSLTLYGQHDTVHRLPDWGWPNRFLCNQLISFYQSLRTLYWPSRGLDSAGQWGPCRPSNCNKPTDCQRELWPRTQVSQWAWFYTECSQCTEWLPRMLPTTALRDANLGSSPTWSWLSSGWWWWPVINSS